MRDNQYFADMREKFDTMEKYISEIKNMVTKLRTSLNELSTDIANGRVDSLEEAKRRVDSIRMFGTEIPPKGHERIDNTPEYSRPFVKCKRIGPRIHPVEVSIDLGSPISDALNKENIQGLTATITWFIQHMINVDLEVKIDKPQYKDEYEDCQLIDLIKAEDSEEPCLILGKYAFHRSVF